MLKKFLSNTSLMTQITVILVIVATILFSFGSYAVQRLDKFRELTEAELIVQKAQVHFKVQVQEWKNILIRGHNEEDFQKYLKKFKQEEAQVAQLLSDIEQHITEHDHGGSEHGHDEIESHDTSLPTSADIDALIAQINHASEQYHAALKLHDPADPTNYRLLDDKVRSIDREIAHELDNYVLRIGEHMEDDFKSTINALVTSLFISGLVAFGLLFAFLHGIRKPLAELVDMTGRLAHGDLHVRGNQEGSNELGMLTHSFNSMAENLSNIVGNAQKSVIQLKSLATNLMATTKEQEASAKETEATTTEIVASTKEISATSKELANSMDEVAQAVDETASLAEQGRGGINQMESIISQMVEASKAISNKLAVLNEKAANITSVVTTINKVADQTNLLSVNAAIEADKAGEYGIGFGTVATEIRRLADQTAVATWDIEQMVKEMQSAVSSSVMGMEKFSDDVHRSVDDVHHVNDQLSQIISRVQSLGPHFENVHEGMHSQVQGADQINQALEQLRDSTRGSSEVIRQANKVITNLNQESERIRETVTLFKLKEE